MATSKEREAHGIANGYRSGLEDTVAAQLAAAGIQVSWEPFKLAWTVPARATRYTPDFVLPNGIIIETKGRFMTADRQKHKNIKDQHPDLDIRFVFYNSRQRLTKTSKTTYGDWSTKYGFQYSHKIVPQVWINEPNSDTRWGAIRKATKQ